MFATFVRLLIVISAIFGLYKLYPRLRPAIDPIIKPAVLSAEIIQPAIRTVNQILPDNLQIPVPTKKGQVDGAATSSNPAANVINSVIDNVKKQAADLANEQIDNLKKETGQAFCQVLIEKVKTECDQ